MPQPIDMRELAERNPQVDLNRLAEGRKMLEDLRRAGIRGTEHRLAIPFTRRRARIMDDLGSDPRVVRLLKPEE